MFAGVIHSRTMLSLNVQLALDSSNATSSLLILLQQFRFNIFVIIANGPLKCYSKAVCRDDSNLAVLAVHISPKTSPIAQVIFDLLNLESELKHSKGLGNAASLGRFDHQIFTLQFPEA